MKMENQFWFLQYDIDTGIKSCDYKTFKNAVELYYDHNKKMWVKRKEYSGSWYPASFPCCSYRAAKRHLRKHNEIPKGTRFRLVSKYVGYDRFLIKH